MCEKNATKKCIVEHVVMDVLNSLIYSVVFYAFLSFVKPAFLCENGDRESDFLQYSPANGVWLSRESLTFCFGLIAVSFFGGTWFGETSGTRRKTPDSLPLTGPTTHYARNNVGKKTNVNVIDRGILRRDYSEQSGEDVSSAASDSSSEASSTSSASYASVASSKASSKASWLSNESHESAVPEAGSLPTSTSFEDTTASTTPPPTNKKTKEEIMRHLQHAIKQNGSQTVPNAITPNASAPNPYSMPVLNADAFY